MISGAPHEARWHQPEPRRILPDPLLKHIVDSAFPSARVTSIEPLSDGKRNSNFKLHLDSPTGLVVLRIYEHDPSLCQKEIDLMTLVADSVPVPKILYTMPSGHAGLPPFAVMRFVEGISFRELRRAGDTDAIAQAAFSAGEVLASIGRHSFQKPGWIAPGPTVTTPLLDGANPLPRFVDLCLANSQLQLRMPSNLRDRTSKLVWSWSEPLAALSAEKHLVHGDFNKRNLLVDQQSGRWRVAAVLDWEFAISGSPLADIANFLRYERAARPLAEPHFSRGYEHGGGNLPPDWRPLSKLLDLAALCESLTHDALPSDVIADLLDLIHLTSTL